MALDPPQKGTHGRATIRDVAAEAGVSKSLVSLVYASPQSVSHERRLRVLDAAERLGFRPNQAARSLAATDGRFVGVLAADSRNPVFADIIDAARAALADEGVVVLVTTVTGGSGRRTDRTGLDVFGDLRPSGLLIAGSVPDMRDLARIAAGRPVVVASGIATDLPEARTVRGDDATGIGLLVDHLIERGHTRIAHAGGAGGPVASLRAEAYRSAMTRHGLGGFVRVERSDYTVDGGSAAARRLLEDQPNPTAVVAVNDLAAVGVLSSVRSAGAIVAVTGYDDTFIARLSPISLTTIDPHSATIGRVAAQLLIDPAGPKETLVPPSLMIRESSSGPAPPP